MSSVTFIVANTENHFPLHKLSNPFTRRCGTFDLRYYSVTKLATLCMRLCIRVWNYVNAVVFLIGFLDYDVTVSFSK
jgi:replication-associated recombination protein RarA